MIDREPYSRSERVLFFASLTAALVLVPLYFWIAPEYERMFRDFGGALPSPTEAYFGQGWLAAALITGIPISLVASLFCARRSKRLFFGVLALLLAIATPLVGYWASQLPLEEIGSQIQ